MPPNFSTSRSETDDDDGGDDPAGDAADDADADEDDDDVEKETQDPTVLLPFGRGITQAVLKVAATGNRHRRSDPSILVSMFARAVVVVHNIRHEGFIVIIITMFVCSCFRIIYCERYITKIFFPLAFMTNRARAVGGKKSFEFRELFRVVTRPNTYPGLFTVRESFFHRKARSSRS